MCSTAGGVFVRLSTILGAASIAGCAALPPAQTDSALIESMASAEFVLLGELHDNAAQHQLRLQWLRALADRAPIAIVSEHFDAGAQSRLDAARHAPDPELTLPGRARRVAEAAGFRFDGWDWSLIGPVVEFALERDLPLRAANLSAGEAVAIMRGQPHPLAAAIPGGWTSEAEAKMSASIRDGHCGLLPESMIPAMVRAQRARDARMAEVLLEVRAGGRRPVLLAGNGHVRRDFGVPLHLHRGGDPITILSVGLLEGGTVSADGVFDRVRLTEAQPRPDPCEPLRARFGSKPAHR